MERFEKLTTGLKNLLQVILAALFVFVAYHLVRHQEVRIAVRKALVEDLGIESLELVGNKISLSKCQAAVSAAESGALTKRGGQDAPPPEKVVQVLSHAEEPESFWSYVGAFKRTTRQAVGHPNFNVKTRPEVGLDIVATTDTYKRATKPTGQKDDWVLGKIVGVVKEEDRVLVKETYDVEADDPTAVNVWIRAVSAPTEANGGR